MKRTPWLCAPPVALCLLDAGLTLLGQPGAYWHGQRDLAVEYNPPFRWLLVQHPLAFAVGAAGWMALFTAFLLAAPARAARLVALLVTCAHAFGAATWLVRLGLLGYLSCAALFWLTKRAAEWSWRGAWAGGSLEPGGRLPQQEGDAIAQGAVAAGQVLPVVGLPEIEDCGDRDG